LIDSFYLFTFCSKGGAVQIVTLSELSVEALGEAIAKKIRGSLSALMVKDLSFLLL
jgi:hypothetical protein